MMNVLLLFWSVITAFARSFGNMMRSGGGSYPRSPKPSNFPPPWSSPYGEDRRLCEKCRENFVEPRL